MPGGARAGLVHMSEDGRPLGEFVVRLDAIEAGAVPTSLVPGKIHRVSLRAGSSHGASFIDVPEGTSRLRVSARSQCADVDLTLTPVPANAPNRPHLAAFPDPAQAPHVASGAGGNHEIERSAPSAGRWFIGLRHGPFSNAAASAELEVQLEGMAPTVRPGSYFNAARGGHGLFLYPAGNQLTGLWYTYLDDGSPTWYYLQGPAPGPDGLWLAGIYRSTWLGDRNALVQIGRGNRIAHWPRCLPVQLSGGRPHRHRTALSGGGCPALGGSTLDASSQWFDPRQAGTGYSVQLWSDYEFYAAFVYDEPASPPGSSPPKPAASWANKAWSPCSSCRTGDAPPATTPVRRCAPTLVAWCVVSQMAACGGWTWMR